jgi:hypothetical protein
LVSKQLGDAIRQWLPSALQFVKPYFTPSDVDKGARWVNEISKELSTSAFGIIVLMPDNLRKPWINFEAGAISRTLDQARVCPIVFGMEPTDVEWPLAQFQVTRFTEEDFHRLFNTINAAAGDNKLHESVADAVFDKWWPDLESDVNKILEAGRHTSEAVTVRPDRQLLEEVLSLVRSISARQEQIEIANQGLANLLGRSRNLATILGGPDPGSSSLRVASPGIGMEFANTPLVLALAETDSKVANLQTKVANLESKKQES